MVAGRGPDASGAVGGSGESVAQALPGASAGEGLGEPAERRAHVSQRGSRVRVTLGGKLPVTEGVDETAGQPASDQGIEDASEEEQR